jgi:TM2 domain-containing membrane protein YozV
MEIEDNVNFCSHCGANLGGFQKEASQTVRYQPQAQRPSHSGPYQQPTAHYQPPQTYLPNKSEIVAVVLSWFVLPGLGQMYAGKISRGLGFLFSITIGGVVVGVSAIWLIWSVLPLFIIFILALVAIQIWCVVDAYQTAAKYNKFVYRNGRPPQSSDIW